MKKLYMKHMAAVCPVLVSMLLASCASSLSYNDALQRNVNRIENTEKLEDARFLVNAASYNILAIQMAEEAVKSAYSASVVNLAKENLEEHEDMGRELRKLARKEDIVLPGKVNNDDEQRLEELKGTERRQFDRTYIRLLTAIAREESEKFEDMATKAQSEEVRAFAARKLDHFKSDERDLERVDAELLQTY